MEELCRACLVASDLLIDIFTPMTRTQDGEQHNLCMADILNELTGCDLVNNYDDASQYICQNCIDGANAAVDFKRMVERSNQHFLGLKKLTHGTKEEREEQELKVKREQVHKDLIAICDMFDAEDLQLLDLDEQTEKPPHSNDKDNTTNSHRTRLKPKKEVKEEPTQRNHSIDKKPRIPKKDLQWDPRTAGRSFQCHYCRMILSSKGNLKSHIRVHTGERPFQCPHCPKAFKQKQGMIVHTRIHTGERPYKCSFCPEAFSQKSGLVSHWRRRPKHKLKTESAQAPTKMRKT